MMPGGREGCSNLSLLHVVVNIAGFCRLVLGLSTSGFGVCLCAQDTPSLSSMCWTDRSLFACLSLSCLSLLC